MVDMKKIAKEYGAEGTAIARWMIRHAAEHRDDAGELDCTGIVEAWDRAECDGGTTMAADHAAWDIAVLVADGMVTA